MTSHLANLRVECALAAGEEAIDWCLESGLCFFCAIEEDACHEDDCPLRPYFDALAEEEWP